MNKSSGGIGCLGFLALAVVLGFVMEHWIWFAIGAVIIVGIIIYVVSRPETDEQKQAKAERATEIQHLKQCDLTTLAVTTTDVLLKRNEFEYYRANNVDWSEPRTHTTRVNYSGMTSSVKIMKGLYWKQGSIKPTSQKVTQNELIHTGTLILTNKRLILLQSDGSVAQITLGTIANLVPYTNGLDIMKTRGKNVALRGSLDGEAAGVVLTRLITDDYAAKKTATATPATVTSGPKIITSVTEETASTPHEPLTAQVLFDNMAKASTLDCQLNEKERFFEFSLKDVVLANIQTTYSQDCDAYADFLSEIQELRQSILENAATIDEDLPGQGYGVRAFFDPGFNTLFAQVRQGHFDYYAPDDPQFPNAAKSPADLTEQLDDQPKVATNNYDELRQLKGLLDDGIISQTEFDAKKKQLLNL
ncbi:SHOCT domain-containing protein [Lactiplantibacillus daowaiensis]|uniref:SHOCT domain-containing protein n=1 Tax=Lactiplantibacillus daowaiensis TaxID=2559918 RepID=A0ABW1S194_9LACO|nr:SHOCT domain-containing protein [Lactiplantibacillus daowaiensis]